MLVTAAAVNDGHSVMPTVAKELVVAPCHESFSHHASQSRPLTHLRCKCTCGILAKGPPASLIMPMLPRPPLHERKLPQHCR